MTTQYLAVDPKTAASAWARDPNSRRTTSMRTELTAELEAEIAAEGDLRHVFIDRNQGGKAPISDQVRAALQPASG